MSIRITRLLRYASAPLGHLAPTRLSLAVLSIGMSLCAGSVIAANGPPAMNVMPRDYRVTLTIDPRKPEFTGHVEIDLNIERQTQVLPINGQNLSVSRVSIRQGTATITGTYSEIDQAGDAEIRFPRPLSKGAATLSFDYEARSQEDRVGLFRGEAGGQWFVLSHFVPTDARRVFPCFDHLNLKVPYTITIIAPEGMLAVSNMPELSETPENGWVRHVFAKSPPLPTYLVAFSVGPFAALNGTVPPTAERSRPIPLRILLPRSEIDQAHFALINTAKIVELLENFYGLPYPFPKLDVIGLPLMKGGMENAGAPIFGDDILVPGPHPSPDQYHFFGSEVGHELAHQWFGNLVTPLWWNDIWLKESFAQETGSIVEAEWRPDLDFATFLRKDAFSEMDQDALPGQPAMRNDVSERDASYGYLFVYGKGAQILAMMDEYLGQKRYQRGIHNFLAAHAYGSVTASDLFRALAAAGHDARIATALRSFTDQPGVPLLSLRRTGRILRITQSRYAPIGVHTPPEQWTIPFCYRQGPIKTCKLITRRTTRIALTGEGPVTPNADGVGYYRFEMPDPEWSTLIAATPRLSGGESLAVSDSLWAAFAAGHLEPSRLVGAMKTLASNPVPDVALDGGRRWMALRDRGIVPDGAVPGYRAALATAYGPRLRRVGFDLRSGAYEHDDAAQQQLRAGLVNIMALGADDPEVVSTLRQATDRFLAGDQSALDTAFRQTAFTLRARTGGRSAAKALLRAANSSTEGTLRPMLVIALGSSNDPQVARWLLRMIGRTGLRPTEEADLVRTMLRYPKTQDTALDWLAANYDSINSKDIALSIGVSMGASLCSNADAARFNRITRARAVRKGETEVLNGTIDVIQSCAKLKAATGSEITATLLREVDSPEGAVHQRH